MTDFDFKTFVELFENLQSVRHLVEGGIDESSLDGELSDPEQYTNLSIFPELKKIEKWGENIILDDHVELKKGNDVYGIQGIVSSSMDDFNIAYPVLMYEFAHIEGDVVEEYFRPLNVDEAIISLFSELELGRDQKGSEEAEKLVKAAIEKSDYANSGLRYKCIMESGNVEVWKIGSPDAYKLVLVAPGFISELDSRSMSSEYIHGEKFRECDPFDPMNDEELNSVRVDYMEDEWYKYGSVDLFPEVTAERERSVQLLASQKLYNTVVKGDFNGVDIDAVPDLVGVLNAEQMAMMMTVSCLHEGDYETVGKELIRVFEENAPKIYQTALSLVNEMNARIRPRSF